MRIFILSVPVVLFFLAGVTLPGGAAYSAEGTKPEAAVTTEVEAKPFEAKESEKTEKKSVEAKTGDKTKAEGKAAAKKADENPYRDQMITLVKEMVKGYSKDQALMLAQIRYGFEMIRTVSETKKIVSQAVDVCGDKNPDIKGKMTARFQQWDGKVSPLLVMNREGMEKSIKTSKFPDEKKVHTFLDLLEKSAAYSDSKIEKNIVSSPEACEGLLQSMDNTEGTMTSILGSLRWPMDGKPLDVKPAMAKDSEAGGGKTESK